MDEGQVASGDVDTRGRVVAAAARLLLEGGASALTTRAVARAAGVQPPTIYRLFGDKDGLVDAVAEHVLETHVAGEQQAAPHPDPLEDLRLGWRAAVEFDLAHPDLRALLDAPGRASSPAARAGEAVLREKVRRLAAAGRLRVAEQRAVAMVHAAGRGVVLELQGQPPDLRDDGLAEAVFDAVARSIATDASALPDVDPRSVVAAFATQVPQLPGLTGVERGLLAEWVDRALTTPS